MRQIRRFRPDLVITQNPQRRLDCNPFIGHPDHLATGEATLASVYPAARDRLNFPELARDEGLEPWKVRQVLLMGVEQPNLLVDVAGTMEIGLRRAACARQPGRRSRRSRAGGPRARAAAGAPRGIGRGGQAFLSILLT